MKKGLFLGLAVLFLSSIVLADAAPAGQAATGTAQEMSQATPVIQQNARQQDYKQETLLSGNIEHGGFGAPAVMLSQVGKNLGVWVGGEGGWIINHTMWIGGAGYGLATNISNTIDNDTYNIYLGYGGGEIGIMVMPEKLIHFAADILIGAGGASHMEVLSTNGSARAIPADTFLVLEPQISLVLNVLENFRLKLGVGYLYSYGLNEIDLNDTGLKGVTGNISFEFGKF